MPISCDTQIDCRQGDITRALFLVSNLLLHVIRVCGVCVCFSIFSPFQGINLSLLRSTENLPVALGGGGAHGPAGFLCLTQPQEGYRRWSLGGWGSGHLKSLYVGVRWGCLRAERGC